MSYTTVYVLVDHDRGVYASMVEVSARLFRHIDPDTTLALVCDEESQTFLTKHRARMLNLFDQVFWEPADLANLPGRSFELKTRVRSLIAGDLAYLDGDTLPIRRFDDIFKNTNWDIALVQDRNHHSPIQPLYPWWIRDRLIRYGWDYPLARYFNAGIMYMRDTPATHELVNNWRYRLARMQPHGDYCDQLPLNCAIHTMTARVLELQPEYNAMIAAHPIHARGAKVLHFFAGPAAMNENSLLSHLVQHLDNTGDIDWTALNRAVELNHPWVPPYWPRQLWQTGNRVRAVLTAVGQRLGLKPCMT